MSPPKHRFACWSCGTPATHCSKGHHLDEHGSWMTRTGRGRVRYCLTCANDNNRERRNHD